MNIRILILLFSLCSYGLPPKGGQHGTRPPDSVPVPGQTLETRPPRGINQTPIFPGQTRGVAAITKSKIKIEILANTLAHPWGFVFIPGTSKCLVTEKPGHMRIVSVLTGAVGPELAGVPEVLFEQDAGLLDVALDPKFNENRRIYFGYVEKRRDGNGLVIARARLSADLSSIEDVTSILKVQPSAKYPAHYGSRLLFDRDGSLFVTAGERFYNPTRALAQDRGSMMGKIFHITTDGTPAPNNPFKDSKGTPTVVWSYGHRNPQGLAFNLNTGALWESEHGPEGGDEINIIEPGHNYGWPLIAYGIEYDGSPVNGGKTKAAGFDQPVYYWDPAIAPSGIAFYSGRLVPEWKDNLFVAGLVGEHLSRLILSGTKVIGEERLLLDQHQRIRDVKEGPDGALWAITDDDHGRLIRMSQ